MKDVLYILLGVIALTIMSYYFHKKRREGFADAGSPASVPTTISKRITSLDAMNILDGQISLFGKLLQGIDPQQQFLVNLCPLTASLGGYIGPITNGVFNTEYYLRKALRAGIRSFILPVSVYFDDNKVPPYWPYSTKPAIVCRDFTKGTILSLNGLTIKKFCQDMIMAKSENNPQIEEPILLTIQAVDGYVPDKIKEEKKYVKLMSDIAKELDILDSLRLTTLGGYGSAIGGQREMEILTQTPLVNLRNKVLIFTDFDPKLALKDAYNDITPKLYDYVNFISQPVVATNAGAATTIGSRTIYLADISGSKLNWTDQARTVWHTTSLDDLTIVPSAPVVQGAIKTGIQSIPVPFYTADTNLVEPIWKLWNGAAWILKEPDARYTQPTPIVPQAPSAALNARVSPNLQPGQTSFS